MTEYWKNSVYVACVDNSLTKVMLVSLSLYKIIVSRNHHSPLIFYKHSDFTQVVLRNYLLYKKDKTH